MIALYFDNLIHYYKKRNDQSNIFHANINKKRNSKILMRNRLILWIVNSLNVCVLDLNL